MRGDDQPSRYPPRGVWFGLILAACAAPVAWAQDATAPAARGPAEPLAPRQPHGGRRADADSAHRRLFGLLPSFLSSGIDEQRLAESRAIDTSEPQITPSPALAVTVSASAASFADDKVRKLQDTLRELQECRKLLDAAVAPEAG